MLVTGGRPRWIDRHAADGVAGLRRCGAVVMRVAGMITVPAAACGRRRLGGWRSGVGGTTASGMVVRLVIMLVFGVVHSNGSGLRFGLATYTR